tara:strand:+ start:11024 stop:11380 length:357 start_codon:yes stop_codon:yes gene_type:complete
MNLGAFSVSLNVKNIEDSLSFYENLGFKIIDGGHQNDGFPDTSKAKWRIIENNTTKIGLFQGMFQQNILTFNPKDVIAIQKELLKNDIKLISKADENSPYKSTILADPDGNQIMLDQM